MPANADDILTATKELLEELYPSIPVSIFKGKPGPDPASELAGWRPGLPVPGFTVSCVGPEEVGTIATFTEIFVRYPVNVTFAKPSNASPGRWEEDPEIREIRQTVRGAFYGKNFTALRPTTFDVRYRTGPVYAVTDDKGQVILSEQWVDFQTYEPRVT